MTAARNIWSKRVNRIFSRSLRYQLLIRSLLILMAILTTVGFFQFIFMERFLYQNKADALRRQILSIPGDIWERFNEGTRGGRQNPVFIFPSSTVVYRDQNGTMTELTQNSDAVSPPRMDDDFYEKAIKVPRMGSRTSYRIVTDDQRIEQLVVAQAVRSFGGKRGVVQVSMSTEPLKAEVYRQLLLYAGISLFALLLGLFFFLPVIRRTLVPLSRVTDTVERIDSGRLNERVPEKQGQSEIDRLAFSFNRMLERIEQSFRAEQEAKEKMERFVSDASHELRTPLTTIHGFLEVLLRGAAHHPEQLERSLRSMYGESERLSKLVRDLLILAKLDRAPALELTQADLCHIVDEMEPQLRLLAEERDVQFDLRAVPRIPLDVDKIKQVILNLFHNAVQHTDSRKGQIHIRTETVDGGIELTVRDNGTGIPAEHLTRVFDRFYRVDESRARIHGGTGLGLSISRSILEFHGGTIHAELAPGTGSLFRIFLPYFQKTATDAEANLS